MIILLNNTLGALHCSDLVVVPGRRHLSSSADLLRRNPLHPFMIWYEITTKLSTHIKFPACCGQPASKIFFVVVVSS